MTLEEVEGLFPYTTVIKKTHIINENISGKEILKELLPFEVRELIWEEGWWIGMISTEDHTISIVAVFPDKPTVMQPLCNFKEGEEIRLIVVNTYERDKSWDTVDWWAPASFNRPTDKVEEVV